MSKQGKKEQTDLKKIFDKYANDYDIDKEPTNEKQKQIDCEWYVYKKLHEKGLDKTNIEKLLEITIDESKEQYNIKQSLETRVGLLLALWGVLITTLLQANIPKQNVQAIINIDYDIAFRSIACLSVLGQVVFGVFSFVYIHKTIQAYGFSTVSLRDKENHFRAAVYDPYISIVQLLDSYTNQWLENSNAIRKKGNYYKKTIKFIVMFTLFVVIGYICTFI